VDGMVELAVASSTQPVDDPAPEDNSMGATPA
jgi:hypothetical protein